MSELLLIALVLVLGLVEFVIRAVIVLVLAVSLVGVIVLVKVDLGKLLRPELWQLEWTVS